MHNLNGIYDEMVDNSLILSKSQSDCRLRRKLSMPKRASNPRNISLRNRKKVPVKKKVARPDSPATGSATNRQQKESEEKDQPEGRHFVADARVVLSLGRDSIKDKATAVLELVKNSYDAGATAVVIEIQATSDNPNERLIRVADNGHGMTSEDLDERFLWIGYSAKIASPTHNGRRRIGEKGVGRLSADRLGEHLELRSQARQKPAVGITIDWSNFDTTRKPIAEILIPDIENPRFHVPNVWPFNEQTEEYEESASLANNLLRPGTELTIRHLRQDWDMEDVRSLWRDLSLLTPPFRHQTDFQIRVYHDLDESECYGVVESTLMDAAEIEAEFALSATGIVTYSFQPGIASKDVHREPWRSFTLRNRKPQDGNGPETPYVGPLKAILYFYPQKATSSMSVKQIRDMLDRMAGIKVYRDGIRVMPYGDNQKEEGGDWLGLGDRKTSNPAGPARSSFRVGPRQLVGAVFISSDDNPLLKDTSAREGLVHDDAFRELKAFVLGCIFRLEAHYHKMFLSRDAKKKERSPRQVALDFGEDLKKLQVDLTSVKSSLPAAAERHIDSVTEKLELAVSQLQTMQQAIEELADQTIIYRGLASVGIAAVVFSHETDVSLNQFQAAALAARNILRYNFTPDKVADALSELSKAIEESKKISAWGKFALQRVKADKRRKKSFNIGKAITDLTKDLKTVFAASSIELTTQIADSHGRAFQMDIESIVINLLTNAYSFSKQTSSGQRKVHLRVATALSAGKNGLQICVSDSGPGVEDAIRDAVWTPLFTTKVDDQGRAIGTGLGLAIVDDIVTDNKGTRSIDRDPHLGGARFTIWIPLP